MRTAKFSAPHWARLPEFEVAIVYSREPEVWGETLRWFTLFRRPGFGRFGDPDVQILPTLAQTNITSSAGSNQSITLDPTWNTLQNTVSVIGAGGRGAHGSGTTAGGAGANGGNFAQITNCTLAASSSVTVQVGAGATVDATAGGDTWFNDTAFPTTGTNKVGAKGGISPAATSASSSAQTAITSNYPASNGAIGGQGGAGTSNTTPGGGGGAAGPSGAGLAGKAGNDATTPRAGGVGDNGTGGAGGVGTSGSPGAIGVAGTEIGGVGSGGGGGGGTSSPSTGGAGGNYGGGGAGGGRSNGVGGNGANGIVILIWLPIVWFDGLGGQGQPTWQPPSKSAKTARVAGAIMPKDDGTQAKYEVFRAYDDTRDIENLPRAASGRVNRAAGIMPIEPGIEARYEVFRPYHDTRDVKHQPQARTAQTNRGAISPWQAPGIEAPYVPASIVATANIHRVPLPRVRGYRGGVSPWRNGAADWPATAAPPATITFVDTERGTLRRTATPRGVGAMSWLSDDPGSWFRVAPQFGVSNQVWDTAHKSATITLSNNRRTATATGATTGQAAYGAYPAKPNSLIYWEVLITGTNSDGSGAGLGNAVGITDDGTGSSTALGADANSLIWAPDSGVYISGLVQTNWANWVPATVPALLCFALDVPNNKLYGRLGISGTWDNDVTHDPATNTGGFVIPFLGAFYPGVGFNDASQVGTANFKPVDWQGQAPAGFGPWPDVDALANIQRVTLGRRPTYRGAGIAPIAPGIESPFTPPPAAAVFVDGERGTTLRRPLLRDVAQNRDPLAPFQPFQPRDWSFYDLNKPTPRGVGALSREDPIWQNLTLSTLIEESFQRVRRPFRQAMPWSGEAEDWPQITAPPAAVPFYESQPATFRRRPILQSPFSVETLSPLLGPLNFYENLRWTEPARPRRYQPTRLSLGSPAPAALVSLNFYEDPTLTYRNILRTNRGAVSLPHPSASEWPQLGLPLFTQDDPSSWGSNRLRHAPRQAMLWNTQAAEWPKPTPAAVPLNFYEDPPATYRHRPPRYSPTRLSLGVADVTAPVTVPFTENPSALYRLRAKNRTALEQEMTLVSFDELPFMAWRQDPQPPARRRVYRPTRLAVTVTAPPAVVPLNFYEEPLWTAPARRRRYRPTRLSLGLADVTAPVIVNFFESAPAVYRLRAKARSALAQSLLLISFDELPYMAWLQDPQPPRLRSYRAGALVRPVAPEAPMPTPAVVAAEFYKDPAVTFRRVLSRAAALAKGSDPDTVPLVGFLPLGWPTQNVQPIRSGAYRGAGLIPGEPASEWPQMVAVVVPEQFYEDPRATYRRVLSRAAAIVKGSDAEIEPIASFFPYGWSPQAFQPPARLARAGALAKGSEAEIEPLLRFFPAGWGLQDFQPPRLWGYRSAAFRNEWLPPSPTLVPFNFYENPGDTYRRVLSKAAAFAKGSDAEIEQLIGFLAAGWQIQDFQPIRPDTYRGAGLIQEPTGSDWPILVAPIIPAQFYENPLVTYRFPLSRSGALAKGFDAETEPFVRFFPYGWAVQDFQPGQPRNLHRWSGALAKGFDAEIEPLTQFLPPGWPIQNFQPPRTGAFHAAAIMPWEPGIQSPFVFVPPPVVADQPPWSGFIGGNMGKMMTRRG